MPVCGVAGLGSIAEHGLSGDGRATYTAASARLGTTGGMASARVMATVTITRALTGEAFGTYENIDWTGAELERHVQNDHLRPPFCIKALVCADAIVDKNCPIIGYCSDQGVGNFQAIVEKVDTVFLKERGWGARALLEAKFSLQCLKRAGFKVLDLHDAACTLRQVREAGYPINEDLGKAGYTLSDFAESGFTQDEILRAGVVTTLTESRKVEYPINKDLGKAGYTLSNYAMKGFMQGENLRAGFACLCRMSKCDPKWFRQGWVCPRVYQRQAAQEVAEPRNSWRPHEAVPSMQTLASQSSQCHPVST